MQKPKTRFTFVTMLGRCENITPSLAPHSSAEHALSSGVFPLHRVLVQAVIPRLKLEEAVNIAVVDDHTHILNPGTDQPGVNLVEGIARKGQ